MKGRLAVFTPTVGLVTETFIHRHMTELAPESTVVVTLGEPQGGPAWTVDVPTLTLDRPMRLTASRMANLRWRVTGSTGQLWSPDEEQLARASAFLLEHDVTTVLFEYLDVWLGFLGLAHGRRAVAAGHGYDLSRSLRDGTFRQGYLALSALDAILVPSEYAASRLRDIGLPGSVIRVIPYSVVVPETLGSEARDLNRCVAAGRLVRKKAPLLTLESFRLAVKERPDLRLQMIGAGPLRDEVRRFVRRHSLEEVVDLAGAWDHRTVLDAIRTAMCFIQHSVTDPRTGDQEGMPLAILEAMAAGTPAVATRHAGIPEAVVDGRTGLLVDEGDTTGMAERIVSLADDEALRRRLGEAGRERVEACFGVSAQIQRLRHELGIPT